MIFVCVFVASGLRGQVSPGASGRGGGDFAEMPRRPHRVRIYGKQPLKAWWLSLFHKRHVFFKLVAYFILSGRCYSQVYQNIFCVEAPILICY